MAMESIALDCFFSFSHFVTFSLFSADFYADMHRLVDSSPARTLQTAHVFYVKDGQRSAVDILENAVSLTLSLSLSLSPELSLSSALSLELSLELSL